MFCLAVLSVTSALFAPQFPALASADCEFTEWWHCPKSEQTGHCNGTAYRYKCKTGISYDHCAPGRGKCSDDIDVESCDSVYKLGKCRPWWSDWSPFTSCTSECGEQQRSQRRHCLGVASENFMAKRRSCVDRRHIASLRKRGRAVSVRAHACPTKRLCPKINGNWGGWGEFSGCSGTCGVGFKQAVRSCDSPAPSGGGLPCFGFDVKRESCSHAKACPVSGGWCPWAFDSCDAECGIGVGVRVRECKCPAPSGGGADCRGVARDTGRCRAPDCPYSRRLLLDERIFLRDCLRENSPEFVFALAGQNPPFINGSLLLHCPHHLPIRRRLFDRPNRFPKRRYFWTKDNRPLNATERVKFNSEHLEIVNVTADDAALYQLMVRRAPGLLPSTVCFYPVPVSDASIVLPEGASVNLTCPLEPLMNVTPSLVGAWRIFWSFRPSFRSRMRGGRSQLGLWRSDTLSQSLRQAGTAQLSGMSVHIEGVYTCHAQLMSVVKANATEDDQVPPDDTEELNSLESFQQENFRLGDEELTDSFEIGSLTLVLEEKQKVVEFVREFFAQRSGIFVAIFCAGAVASFASLAGDSVNSVKLFFWRRRQKHLDAEEMQLLKARLVERKIGVTRQHQIDAQDARRRREAKRRER